MDQTAAGSGWTMWKAVDETLARSVSVLTFAPGFPRIPDVVTAARAASRLTDPRLAQVFDVEDGGDQAYIVMEWVSGESLADLIAETPLDSARACALLSEASRALAGAHAAGLAHLCLSPQTLRWTRSSGVKITGLGIDAALAGAGLTDASDPSLSDTRDLAALLYAALTGYWPGDTQTGLPPAPLTDGEVCTPRQVSPDVPAPIDAVVTRALLQRTTRQGPPIVTPETFADAIASVAPPIPLPDPAPPVSRGSFDPYEGGQRGGYGGRGGGFQGGNYQDQGGYPNQGGYGGQDGYGARGGYQPNPNDPSTWNTRSGGAAGYQRRYQQPARRSGASRAVITVVVVLVLVAVAAGAWELVNTLGKSNSSGNQAGGSGASSGKGSSSASGPTPTELSPQGAKSFDILGNSPSPENQNLLNPVKGSGPPWQTQNYDSSDFGKLKNGDGYLIEMGRTIRLTSLKVDFAGSPAKAGICIGDGTTTTTSGTDMSTVCPEGFTSVAPQQVINGETTFSIPGSSAVGQNILIWFTQMTSSGNESISKVTVYGSAATSAG
ncbi:MAG: protein kinase family protein [Trebonia sp.]